MGVGVSRNDRSDRQDDRTAYKSTEISREETTSGVVDVVGVPGAEPKARKKKKAVATNHVFGSTDVRLRKNPRVQGGSKDPVSLDASPGGTLPGTRRLRASEVRAQRSGLMTWLHHQPAGLSDDSQNGRKEKRLSEDRSAVEEEEEGGGGGCTKMSLKTESEGACSRKGKPPQYGGPK